MVFRNDKSEDEDLGELEPPSLSPRWKLPNLGVSGGFAKTAVVAFAVTLLMLVAVPFAGGMGFVTKIDFATNVAAMVTSIEQIGAGVSKAQSDLSVAIGGIPSTVSGEVNRATSQWNGQMTALSDRVNSINSSVQSNASKISELTTRVDINLSKLLGDNTKISGDVDVLKEEVTALQEGLAELDGLGDDVDTQETAIKALSDKITAIETKIATMESQFATTLVEIVPLSQSPFAIVSGSPAYTNVGVKVVNKSTATVAVYLRLLLTPTTAGVEVSAASTSGVSTASRLAGGVVAFDTSVSVGAGQSVSFFDQPNTGVKMTYTYTGDAPSWAVSWSVR